jgi:oligopeptide transport system substrate-binding protein
MYQPSEPYNYLMRSYTNRELVSYNGKDYCDFVDDVYKTKNGITKENFSLTGILNGEDPIYNADKAKKLFQDAKAELLEAGLKESDFPIKIDVIGDMDVETQAYFDAMYDSINKNGEGIVKISVNVPATEEQDTDWGSISNNYDFSMWSGWGPDYADPNTYGHTMCIGGDMVEQFGF